MRYFSPSTRARSAPPSPATYRERNDPGVRALLRYADKAGDSSDPLWHIQQIRTLLGQFPLRRIEREIHKQGAEGVIEAVLTPYVEAEALRYSQNVGAFQRQLPPLPPECVMAFDILWAGDPDTAKHSIDAGFATGAYAHALANLDQHPIHTGEEASLYGLVHDFGKPDSVPRILLENPVFRNLMPALYAVELGNPGRLHHPLASPFPLNAEQNARFGPLLSGSSIHPDDVSAFVELCSQYKGPIDYRVIPVRALLNFGRHILIHNELPSQVMDYVTRYMPGRVQQEDIDFMIQKLRSQKKEYEWMNWILARFGIDGWRHTFKDVIETHESASARMLPPYLGCVVRDHHGYEKTPQILSAQRIYLPDPEIQFVLSLQMGDITTALAANRVYFRGGNGFPPSTIAQIVRSSVERRGFDPQRALHATRLIIPSGDSSSPLRSTFAQIHQSGLAVYS